MQLTYIRKTSSRSNYKLLYNSSGVVAVLNIYLIVLCILIEPACLLQDSSETPCLGESLRHNGTSIQDECQRIECYLESQLTIANDNSIQDECKQIERCLESQLIVDKDNSFQDECEQIKCDLESPLIVDDCQQMKCYLDQWYEYLLPCYDILLFFGGFVFKFKIHKYIFAIKKVDYCYIQSNIQN